VVLPVPVGLPSSAWRKPIHQHHIHCPAHRKWEGGWRATQSLLKTQGLDISHPFSAGWPESDMALLAAREAESGVFGCIAVGLTVEEGGESGGTGSSLPTLHLILLLPILSHLDSGLNIARL